MRPIATFTIGVSQVFTGTYNPEVALYFGSLLVTIVDGKITKIGRYTIDGDRALNKSRASAQLQVVVDGLTTELRFNSSDWFQMKYILETVDGYTFCKSFCKIKMARSIRSVTLDYDYAANVPGGILRSSSRCSQRNRHLPEQRSVNKHWPNGHISESKHGNGNICHYVQNSSHSGNVYSTCDEDGVMTSFRTAPVPNKAYYVQQRTQRDLRFYELDDIVLIVHKTPIGTSVNFTKGNVRASTQYCSYDEFVGLQMVGANHTGIFTWTGESSCMVMIHGAMYSFNIALGNPSYTVQQL